MERKINKLEHCLTEVEVTFSTEEWKDAQKKIFNKLAKTVKINGFKDPTKAPEKMIKDRIDPYKLMNDSINELLPVAYQAIVMEDKIEPFAQPQIDIVECTDDKLVVKFTIAGEPDVKLGKYKGLNLVKDEVKVTDEEVNAEIAKIQEEYATLSLKDGEAANGDTVVIDFIGKTDGVAFDGGTASNYELVLGSNSFIPGFEDQCLGHKAGDKFTINVTFPENYVENLKGKPATFDITLHEVKSKIYPELDEEFIKQVNIEGVNTVDELKENKRKFLADSKESEARRAFVAKVLDEIAKDSKIEIAEQIIASETEARVNKISENLKQQGGFTLEQYLQVLGKSKEDFDKENRAEAEKAVRNQSIIEAIVKEEKLTLSDEEFDAELQKLADQYKMKLEDVKKAIQGREAQFRADMVYGKAEKLLAELNAKKSK